MGLVSQVLPAATLVDGVREYARELASLVSPRLHSGDEAASLGPTRGGMAVARAWPSWCFQQGRGV